ncbi:MAG TPA: M28 family peptidase, partial [Gemmatimonadales bacterium]
MRSIVLLVLAQALPVTQAALLAQAARPAESVLRRIDPDWITPHVRFLASDLLEGRETATRGARLAAEYVAAELESLGLEPLGTQGTFLQRIPLRHSLVDGVPSLRVVGGAEPRELVYGTDFLLQPDIRQAEVTIQAPLVFVGFGLTLPAHGHDDYAGVDAKGKLAVLLPGGPQGIPSDERGHATLLRAKEANALAHGAVGIVTLWPLPAETLRDRFMRQLSGFSWLSEDGTPQTLYFEQGATVRLSATGAATLFTAAGASFPEVLAQLQLGKSRSFDLPVELKLSARFTQVDTAGANVVGLLRGSDPALRDEYVVYTAHLDHVGMGRPVNGDSVHHGALDNAGGTATLLAMARAFASLPAPPRRSVLFVAVTAEEKGILGSHYFVNNPPAPAGQIVANVNMDNYLMLHPVRDLAAYGASYSTLDGVVRRALGQLGVAVSADAAPEQTIFTRSDHYPFMLKGIPAV